MDPRYLSWVCTALILAGAYSKVIDLSHAHKPNTFMVPGMPKYKWNQISKRDDTKKNNYYETGSYSTGEHGGTHLDAPAHFVKGGLTLEFLPIENTIAEGVMIDCSEEARQNPRYQVTVEKIESWESEHGPIPQQAAVIFNFGWFKFFDDPVKFVGTSAAITDNFVFPTISEEAGEFLLRQRDIKIIGADVMSPDPFTIKGVQVDGMPIHQRYLARNRVIVENLNATDQLPPRGFRFYASPVKFHQSTGAQVRAFAVIGDSTGGNSASAWNGAATTVISLVTVALLAALVY
ncbi:isatin hydrolase-like [Physella acuta]|uniref:isatin hydrolase-like n=1 Tax=Physella acuta TaxID=109671 RepID=UPI0027DC2CCE|nr:isatin hydrolase-like [Physella acuta]XP_059148589.1 isatin hydrolase-like [Physella acuta]XP_059148590.1 isatin hydrolase-like [Physella acuta]